MLYTKTLCALSRATAFSFEVSSAEELSNRATLEIMIDKIRQQLRLLPCYIKSKRSLYNFNFV